MRGETQTRSVCLTAREKVWAYGQEKARKTRNRGWNGAKTGPDTTGHPLSLNTAVGSTAERHVESNSGPNVHTAVPSVA